MPAQHVICDIYYCMLAARLGQMSTLQFHTYVEHAMVLHPSHGHEAAVCKPETRLCQGCLGKLVVVCGFDQKKSNQIQDTGN